MSDIGPLFFIGKCCLASAVGLVDKRSVLIGLH